MIELERNPTRDDRETRLRDCACWLDRLLGKPVNRTPVGTAPIDLAQAIEWQEVALKSVNEWSPAVHDHDCDLIQARWSWLQNEQAQALDLIDAAFVQRAFVPTSLIPQWWEATHAMHELRSDTKRILADAGAQPLPMVWRWPWGSAIGI